MDFILETADDLVLDATWAKLAPSSLDPALSAFARDSIFRQAVSLYTITLLGVFFIYFGFATASYYFVFDHRMMKHPRFLKNQVKLEIQCSLKTFLPLDALTLPWFLGEVRGHSLLYRSVGDIKGLSLAKLSQLAAPVLPASVVEKAVTADWHVGGGWSYLILSSLFFLWFTDLLIYFIHRFEHHPRLYKHIHKPHHRWIIPTPFASHAFHPLDGYAQSLPYHFFVYLFPLHRMLYMGLFIFVNFWSILIHDSEMITDHPLEHVINGPSHHTLHHIHFTVNYGQYFTWADRFWGSYRHPAKGEDPLNAVLAREERRKLAEALKETLASPSAPAPTAQVEEKPIPEIELSPSVDRHAALFTSVDPDLLRSSLYSRSSSASSLSSSSGRSSPVLFSPSIESSASSAPTSCYGESDGSEEGSAESSDAENDGAGAGEEAGRRRSWTVVVVGKDGMVVGTDSVKRRRPRKSRQEDA